ncbi:MAG: hypothetical protein J7K46_10480 [Bacteroidales bacterium]|nr:hypothetical protein [Bacteroidales bacterium]
MKTILKNATLLFFMTSIFLFQRCKKENVSTIKDPDATEYIVEDNRVTVRDHGLGTGTITWTSDKIWILDHLVFVNEGQTLTIETGTVIKGKSGQENDASALVVARGGRLIAVGTRENPIIFTAEADDLNGNIPLNQRGLWGGVILLGKAKLNSSPGETAIEGIPTTEPRGLYGGNDDNDNSGILKYVSIRHGGTDIGEGNEINGLTLGGVGSKTIIEYIEIIANKDDGVEIFGGRPGLKHILVSFCGDDGLDYDEGCRARIQFYTVIQDPDAGDRLGEHDGGTDPETGEPYAIPYIYNATFIGRGTGAGKRVITFRDNAGGHYYNSLFANQVKGIDVELLAANYDSYKQLSDNNLSVEHCLFQNIADGTAAGIFRISAGSGVFPTDSAAAAKIWAEKFNVWKNTITDKVLVSRNNPIPPAGTAQNGIEPTDPWFDKVTWQGAFKPGGENWAAGWTLFFRH